jgi:hypothetical protein
MTTISARGWRRNEPGLVSAIEAVELLTQEGIDETHLIEQCRVPRELFHIVTARIPELESSDSTNDLSMAAIGEHRVGGRVVSLLEWQQFKPGHPGTS